MRELNQNAMSVSWGALALCIGLVFLFSGLFAPASAFSIGDFVLNWIFGPGGFYCVGPNPVGKLFDTGGIPPGVDSTQMFTFFVAKFEDIMSEIYSTMFCGMQDAIAYPLSAVLTFFVVIMGAGFLIGIIPLTGKELAVIFAKFVLVLTFTTQADLAIGVLYNFLVTSAREGIEIVLSTIYLPGGGTSSTAHVFGLLDDAFRMVIDKTAMSGLEANACQNGLFAFLALALIAFPTLFMFAFVIVVKLVIAFVRAVFGYLFALLGITFLLTLLPIFASLALFKPTRNMFDKYLGYLTSFAFQMIVVFAFLAMVLSMNIYDRFGSTFNLVMPVQDKTYLSSNASVLADLEKIVPLPVCTICKNDRFYENKSTGSVIASSNVPDGTDILNDYKDLGFHCYHDGAIVLSTDSNATPLALEDLQGMTASLDDPDADPFSFMKFVAMQVLMLAALAYLIEGMLGFVPELARHLGGQIHAAQLGGGENAAGYGAQIQMLGSGIVKNVADGFDRGYNWGAQDGGTTIDALSRGFSEASASLLVGARDKDGNLTGQGGGIIDAAGGVVGGLGGSRKPPGGGM